MDETEPILYKDDFDTIYRQDFKSKTTPGVKPILPLSNGDILTEPFQHVLLPEKCKLEKKTLDLEPMGDFYKRILKSKPSLQYHLKTEPDINIVSAVCEEGCKSLYQYDYSIEGYGYQSLKASDLLRIDLPSNWVIPKTSAETSYRHFRAIINYNLSSEPANPPKGNLTPNPELRKILQVKTGISEYQRNIGTLGGDIIREQFLGKIIYDV